MKPLLTDLGLLVLRLASGGLMALNHGWGKLINFGEKQDDFYDWLGLGPGISLGLAVFAEFFCGVLLVLGFATRIAAVPLLITMAVAFFAVHAGDPFKERESSFLFMLLYLAVTMAGPGKISLDQLFLKRLV